ncbi:MAG: hypothetical protein IPP71_13155 [Bacteroidetes bacterium]|nr:hypothetical protein [Bacteroidota bacterium]
MVIINEINRAALLFPEVIASNKAVSSVNNLTIPLTPASYQTIKNYLGDLRKYFIAGYKNASNRKDAIVKSLTSGSKNAAYLNHLKTTYTNESLKIW